MGVPVCAEKGVPTCRSRIGRLQNYTFRPYPATGSMVRVSPEHPERNAPDPFREKHDRPATAFG